MKKLQFLVIVICMHTCVYGQELSLEQALSQAKSSTMDQSQMQANIEAINVRIHQSKKLPMVYVDGNIQRNLITPVTPVPSVAFDPNAAEGDITPLKFATDWSVKVGVQASYDLYDPQKKANIRNAQFQEEKARLSIEESKQSLDKTITDLYVQACLAQEQLNIAVKNRELYLTTLQVIEDRYKAGRVSAIELNNARKKMIELNQLGDEAAIVLGSKYIALGQYIDMRSVQRFSTPLDSILQLPQNKNYDLERLAIDKNIKSEQLEFIRKEAYPKLTLNGYLGAQHFSNDFDVFNSTNWYGNSYLNIAVRVPISEFYERNLRIEQSRQEHLLAQSKYDELLQNQTIDNQKLQNEILALEGKINMLETSVTIVGENIAIYLAKIEEGTALVSEVNKEIETQLDLQKKLWQAQYDLMQKKLELRQP